MSKENSEQKNASNDKNKVKEAPIEKKNIKIDSFDLPIAIVDDNLPNLNSAISLETKDSYLKKISDWSTPRIQYFDDDNKRIRIIANGLFDKSNDWLINDSSSEKQLKLQQEINELRLKLKKAFDDVKEAKTATEDERKALETLNKELQSKEKINHILTRICEDARSKMLSDESFSDEFQNGKNCDSVVVSIDIRRSTELMLKARKPELFSQFITKLSQELSEVIISNFGIFDKFTGDGILAFFPKFYSGEEAIIRALKAAHECHVVFDNHYRASRHCFNVFIQNVGLGIGIDYGSVTLVNTRNELTVVGIPVVYACRMGGAKAGDTLLNQPAKEEIERLADKYIKVTETEIEIKNEGSALAYKIELHENSFQLEDPKWLKEMLSNNPK